MILLYLLGSGGVYMDRYGLADIQAVFDKQYNKVLDFEVIRLRDALIQSYNSFVRSSPYHKEVVVCNNGRTKQSIHRRRLTNANVVNKNFNQLKLFKVYTRIRNIEEGSPFKTADMLRIMNKLDFFYKRIGPQGGLNYVNEQFRSLYKFKSGGGIDLRRRMAIRKEQAAEDALKTDTVSAVPQAPASDMSSGGGGSGGSSGGSGY